MPRRAKRLAPGRSLCEAERAAVLQVLYEARFRDRSPAAVQAILLDEGEYLCSTRPNTDHLRRRQPNRFSPSGSVVRASTPDEPDGSWACVRGWSCAGRQRRCARGRRSVCRPGTGCCVAGFQLLAGKLIGNAVIVPVNLHMVVDGGADRFAFRHHIALSRQGLKKRGGQSH